MKTNFRFPWGLIVLAALLGFSGEVQAMLNLRVSVKIFLDQNGNLPTAINQFNFSTRQRIEQEFQDYNRVLDRMGWGFRFELTEVVQLSGSDGGGGDLSRWFGVNARDGGNRGDLEVQAKLHPVIYAYRPNAFNVYVNNSSSGVAFGAHLPLLGDVIFVGAQGYWTLIWHEINHSLGLCHTHGCNCNDNCLWQSDNIADTIWDSDSWTSRDQIATNNFNLTYDALGAAQRRRVDDIWGNIMSYHNNDGTNLLDRLTHDQWEVIVDTANLQRLNTASGRTRFVDPANTCLAPEDLSEPFRTLAGYVVGWSWGTRNGLGVVLDPRSPPPGAPALPCPPVGPCSISICLGGPFKTVLQAVNDAAPGDRLQIKAGTYGQRMRITKRLTLSTDRGVVRLGAP